MFKKTMKKIVCGVLAVSATVACMGTMTACETNHPEVKMEISFNGETGGDGTEVCENTIAGFVADGYEITGNTVDGYVVSAKS